MSGDKFGFDLLARQIADEVEIESLNMLTDVTICGEERARAFGDSPIERLFFFSLHFYLLHGETFVEHNSKGLSWLKKPLEECERSQVYIAKQVQIEGVGRVDFVISAYATCTLWEILNPEDPPKPHWRHLVIECDGHDFHERTKEQAARDRSRDRSLQTLGYEFFRFTGSELWRNPIGAAKEVIKWMESGV